MGFYPAVEIVCLCERRISLVFRRAKGEEGEGLPSWDLLVGVSSVDRGKLI